jgi:RPA family protein
MEQNESEAYVQNTAQLVIYVKEQLGLKPTKQEKDLDTYYTDTSKSDKITRTLCSLITKMDDETRNKIVYNGKDKTSRRLADWWDEHQEADKKRLADEAKQKQKEKIKKSALSKLSEEERKALGL